MEHQERKLLIKKLISCSSDSITIINEIKEEMIDRIFNLLDNISTSEMSEADTIELVKYYIKDYLFIDTENRILLTVKDDNEYIVLQFTSSMRDYDENIITGETTVSHYNQKQKIVDNFEQDFSEEDLDIAISVFIKRYINLNKEHLNK